MVPTELLAVQHYDHLLSLLEKFKDDNCKPSIALLTGSTPSKQARLILNVCAHLWSLFFARLIFYQFNPELLFVNRVFRPGILQWSLEHTVLLLIRLSFQLYVLQL